MLVLTIATARQDPLMSYYPTITNIVITIASTSARVALYE